MYLSVIFTLTEQHVTLREPNPWPPLVKTGILYETHKYAWFNPLKPSGNYTSYMP
jgi:hypothetical protein